MLPRRKALLALLSATLLLPLGAAAEPRPAQIPERARVARALFTTGIENREPVDRVVALDNSHREIYFFSEVRHMQGRTIKHVWEYRGQPVSEVEFQVGGPRWRVNSKKALDPGMTGVWTVWVVDAETGWPLKAAQFEYRPAKN